MTHANSTWSFAGDSIIDVGRNMLEQSGNVRNRFRGASILSGCILAALVFISYGCKSKPAESGPRFHLHGKIVLVDLKNGSADVNHDAIPGFMDAMTMPYPVPDAKV